MCLNFKAENSKKDIYFQFFINGKIAFEKHINKSDGFSLNTDVLVLG